jgi:O-antigen ligase
VTTATRLPPLPAPPIWYPLRNQRLISDVDFWGSLFLKAIVLFWASAVVIGFAKALALFAILGFTGALAGIRWPVAGLYSVGILSVLDTPIRACLADGSTIFRENTFNYLLFFTSAIYLTVLLKRRDVHTILLTTFIGLLVLELAVSPDKFRGILHIINGCSMFGLLVFFVRGTRDHRTWYWLALLNGMTAALAGAIYYLQKSSVPPIDRNGLSYCFLTAIFTICIAFPFAQREHRGPLYLGILATICACWVFLTTSRSGAMMGLFASLCLLAEIKGIWQRMMLLGGGFLIALLLLTQFSELGGAASSRFEKLMDSERSWASRTSGRSELMRGALDMFSKHPWGVGTGGYSVEWSQMSRDKGRYSFGVGKESSSHSAWMKTLSENGIPGLLLLIAFVFSYAWEGIRRYRHGLMMIGMLPTVAFSVAFFTTEFQGKGLWFLAAGVAVLMHKYVPNPRRMKRRLPASGLIV